MRGTPMKIINSTGRSHTEESMIILPAAKIHRANIISRILCSLSVIRQEWAFHRLEVYARRRKVAGKKMHTALSGAFRKNQYQGKFQALQKLKKQFLKAAEQDLSKTQKIVKGMQKSSKKIMFIMLRHLRKQKLFEAFTQIKRKSAALYFQKRNRKRKAIRVILYTLLKNKRWAYERLTTNRVIEVRKQRVKKLFVFLQNRRIDRFTWSLWKMRKNMMQKRREQISLEVKAFQQKINNHEDPELKAIQQKKKKLEEHLQKIQQQKNELEEQHNAELRQVQKQKQEVEDRKEQLIQGNRDLQDKIKSLQEQIKTPYTTDEIYQCLYNNFLLYISENKEQVYNKQEVLASLTQPLLPIEVPIKAIKEENQVMEELLSQYILMFGQKKLEEKVELPYEYLVKQNHAMYKMLMTLLPQTDSDREDLRLLKDGIFKLNTRVNEVWGPL